MTGDTYLLTQICIALGAGLLISALVNLFQRNLFTKVNTAHQQLLAAKKQLSLQQMKPVELEDLSAFPELNMLAVWSNDQLAEVSHIEWLLKQPSLGKDPEHLALVNTHIEWLRKSVFHAQASLNHLNHEIKELQNQLAMHRDQTQQIKKLSDNVASLTLHEKKLLKQVAALNEELALVEQKYKKLKQEQENDTPAVNQSDLESVKKELQKAQDQIKRSEAERTLLENHYIELEAYAGDSKKLSEELQRLKKEYAMLEQRFIDE